MRVIRAAEFCVGVGHLPEHWGPAKASEMWEDTHADAERPWHSGAICGLPIVARIADTATVASQR